uniref:Endosome protein n=1 Tax=Melanopsichium pennsylvanicum 4 TaxID=1398559 RepID=A0A077RDN4_9BASI|nr:endosome protein [Melanopsichium pennsylvanicum 4]
MPGQTLPRPISERVSPAKLEFASSSLSSPIDAPLPPSTDSFASSSTSRTPLKPKSDTRYTFRQSVLDMDALLTFADDDRDPDDVPAIRPRFKRPFGMSGERMFNQQLKSIGHAQDPSPTVKSLGIIDITDEPVYQHGPLDVGREEELEGTGGLDGIEQRWLDTVEEPVQRGYRRAKDWILAYPPGTQSTDITLSQFLSIQEKGVSAWSFDPDYESNPSVFVEARTEITFIADGEGMAPQEGGGVCVQSNLPLPKINEVYYWEVKMFNKPDSTNVAVGLTTKPYPQFRLPGWSKYSIGYFSSDGFKCHNYPFAAQSYGPAYGQGDVIGIGYRPRTGTAFFTRNGKRLEDAFIGLNRYNLFPTVGADGACEIHVNLGQAGFVFIEANVKKWGLAPMVGTLAPPPAYGQERGTILMESGQGSSADAQQGGSSTTAVQPCGGRESPPPPISPYDERSPSSSHNPLPSHQGTSSPAPTRTSSLRPNGQAFAAPSRPTSRPMELDGSSDGSPPNPPTPHRLDISLHSLSDASNRNNGRSGAEDSYFPTTPPSAAEPHLPAASANASSTNPNSPPSYAAAISYGALGGTSTTHHQARRGSGRTHQLANAVLGMLGDRGLLQSLNHSNPSPMLSPGLGGTVYGGQGSGYGGGLSEAEYERMLRRNTATNSRSSGSGNGYGRGGVGDYSLTGWANWLGLRGAASRGRGTGSPWGSSSSTSVTAATPVLSGANTTATTTTTTTSSTTDTATGSSRSSNSSSSSNSSDSRSRA